MSAPPARFQQGPWPPLEAVGSGPPVGALGNSPSQCFWKVQLQFSEREFLIGPAHISIPISIVYGVTDVSHVPLS